MHKDGNCKEVMRKIKEHWGNFTDEDLVQMQQAYEERERKVIRKYRYHTEELRSDS